MKYFLDTEFAESPGQSVSTVIPERLFPSTE